MLMDLYISNWLLKIHYFKGGPASAAQQSPFENWLLHLTVTTLSALFFSIYIYFHNFLLADNSQLRVLRSAILVLPILLGSRCLQEPTNVLKMNQEYIYDYYNN